MRVGTDKFREWCRRLRQLFPLDRPVRIRRLKLSDKTMTRFGVAWSAIADDGYDIVIHKGLDWCSVSDCLMHEWCHLRRHEDSDGAAGHLHDDEFWTEFGKIYRTFHKEK